MKIGIAISTHNRPEIFKESYNKWIEFLPFGAKLIVVDDASKVPVPEATFRFDTQQGIAKTKNKCFELLEDCDIIVLSDDDAFPIVKDWHIPYINSGLNHAMMIFQTTSNGVQTGNKIIKRVGNLNYFLHPAGCVLFYRKICLEIAGGMDEWYGIWGHEHADLSLRIYNNGLTPYPYIDVDNSLSMFHSHDYFQTVERSVPPNIRKQHIKRNTPKFNASKKSKEFIPYKQMKGRVITTYFTGVIDPQRNAKWDFKRELIQPLINSVVNMEEETIPLTFLSDCIPEQKGVIEVVHVDAKISPYLQRWVSFLEYLKVVQEDYVFCVDATDVEMMHNPFKNNLGNYIWVGDEPGTINNEWLLKHHKQPLFESFFKTHKNKPLLNAGVIGGRKCVIKPFVERMVWYIQNHEILFTDMALFNYVLYTEFEEQIKHGRQVTNVFKSYSKSGNSWFAHK